MSICSTLNVTWSIIYFSRSVCACVCARSLLPLRFTISAQQLGICLLLLLLHSLSVQGQAGRMMWRGFPRRRGTTHTHTASCTTILCGELLLCVVKRSLYKISKWKPLTEHKLTLCKIHKKLFYLFKNNI